MVRPILAVLALVPFLYFAPLASAQTAKWDQAAVTDGAGNLVKSLSGLREILQGSPQLQQTATRRVMFEIMDNLRQMEFMSESLFARLKGGEAMEETLPTYNKLQQTRRYTEVLAEKVDITAVTRPKLDEAEKWLGKLEPYYPAQPVYKDLR